MSIYGDGFGMVSGKMTDIFDDLIELGIISHQNLSSIQSVIAGGIKGAIDAHGPITKNLAPSAAKRAAFPLLIYLAANGFLGDEAFKRYGPKFDEGDYVSPAVNVAPKRMYRTTGTIRYSLRVRNLPEGKWWCVLDCDEEIGRYYRSMFNFVNRAKFSIIKPAWGSHISIVRNEMPKNPEIWHLDAGKQIEFEYGNEIQTNGEYYWLDVLCPEAFELRERLGLDRIPHFPLHLTIGRIV